MAHHQVDAGDGWNWIARGWGLFTQSAGPWLLAALVFGILYIVLSLIPLMGGIAAAVLGPALFGGLVYGARELDRGATMEVGHIFQAFREPGRAGPMLVLGLVPLVAAILSGVLAAMLIGGAAGVGAASGSEGAAVGMAAGGGLVAMLLSFVIAVVVGALLLFAIPRVMFGLAPPGQAIGESLQATLANIGAYLVFAVIYLVFAIIAAIPLGLGFLILIPVMAGAVYSAHRAVFGGEADPVEAETGA
jgi:uncharacterized membrane protein